jgi:DNA repair protein RadC
MKNTIIRYSNFTVKQVVLRLKDVEDIPEGFSREQAICSPEDLVKQYHFMFDGLMTERFVCFVLNANNKVISANIVTEGILNSSLAHPREVFRPAIVCGAAAIIIAHNHPSGNPEPSQEDVMITKQLVEAGKILGIPVHDHIIFAEERFTSFADRRLI